MKTTFNSDDIRQLLQLSDSQRQELISFIDSCDKNPEASATIPTPADDAPDILKRLHSRELKRRKATLKRNTRKLEKLQKKSDKTILLMELTIQRQSRYIESLQEHLKRFSNCLRLFESLPKHDSPHSEQQCKCRSRLITLIGISKELIDETQPFFPIKMPNLESLTRQ